LTFRHNINELIEYQLVDNTHMPSNCRLRLSGATAAIVLVLLADNIPAAQPPDATAFVQAVSVATPVRIQLTRSLQATGSVYAWQEVIVAPEVGGYQVAAVNVDIGDQVRRGQELLRLSSEMLESQVAVARAGVSQAAGTLANATAARDRGEMVATSGALSRADLDTLRANFISAQAGVASAQANLDAAELRLRFTRVLAPDAGVITARTVTIGQVVQAGTEVMRLLRQGRVEWRAEIPEADMRAVRSGQVARITMVEGVTMTGKVRTIAPTVQSSNRTALAYVDLPANSGARPGMFARGEIDVSRSAALMVPVASVLVQDGYSYVFVCKADSTVQRRRVVTGIVQSGQIEITNGLADTERVVSSGGAFLSDGQRVNLQAPR
jgi:RND family efflux transporter MFP subunit